MFWKRSRREERRQKVLDELMALDPAERRTRLDQAVAVGDVQVGEVDSTLRLIDRLEALRVLTIRPHGDESEETVVQDGSPSGEILEAVGDPPSDTSETVIELPHTVRPAPRRTRRPVGVSVEASPVQARRWLESAAMPMDALEAASRLVAREKATRKARAAALSSRQRRVRTTRADAPAPQFATQPAASPAPVPVMAEPAAESSREENWPSIAWLRP